MYIYICVSDPGAACNKVTLHIPPIRQQLLFSNDDQQVIGETARPLVQWRCAHQRRGWSSPAMLIVNNPPPGREYPPPGMHRNNNVS